MHDDGQVFSNLYPFRESFYERLGYVTFPLTRIAKLAPSAVPPLMDHDLGGRIELTLIGDGYDMYREYLARMRQRTHGMGLFVLGDRAAARAQPHLAGAGDGKGETVGLMLYDLKGDEADEIPVPRRPILL